MTPASHSLTRARKRRLTRLRATALPTFRDTVSPMRAGPPSSRDRPCSMKLLVEIFWPAAAARKSALRRSRSVPPGMRLAAPLCAEALAPARPARRNDLAAADRGDPRAETVTAFAHQLAGLIGPLHGSISAGKTLGRCAKRKKARIACSSGAGAR